MDDVRIMLADDHEVVRMGIRVALEDRPGLQVVGEAESAAEAVRLWERLQPEIVVLDIRMPGGSGIEACREIVSRWPRTRVIMLTSYVDDHLISDAIRAGAIGYVLKRGGAEDLIRAIEAAHEDVSLLDPAVARRVLELVRRGAEHTDPFHELTPREVMVLYALSQGMTNSQIAENLTISDKTVRNHVSSVFSKLGVTGRVEAATYAIQNRIEEYVEIRGLQP